MIDPASISELVEAVSSTPKVLAVGAQTKSRLCLTDAVQLCTKDLRGIIEYDPGEFTFTALAGTPMSEIIGALAERGQHLPFDPMLVEGGATLGGTVASGLSGPGRFRHGGVRDFILGVRFVDGLGRLLRMGGKVVKNAAGFDLPKFFVGSLGRFGVLAEITFKVFPKPPSTITLRLDTDGIEEAVKVVSEAGRMRWEADALEIVDDTRAVLIRLAAPQPALDSISAEVLGRWRGRVLPSDEAKDTWQAINEFRWASDNLVKVPATSAGLSRLHNTAKELANVTMHFSGGGDVAYISTSDLEGLAKMLTQQSLKGLLLRGEGPLWLGVGERPQIWLAVKQALDPQQRFPD